ncbi:MAG: AbrB/MazE/SpoVT family DNA-binding domain-containing protein [Clostridiales bacterium]|nr:AbrB/MazE/SpoVT family DNA-binding domain-containing protein [Clostridiales bacterium]
MQVQVKTWGNSQGVRIPRELLQSAGISLNDTLEMTASDGLIQIKKNFRHKTLEERAQEYGGSLNLDGENNWRTPEGREAW